MRGLADLARLFLRPHALWSAFLTGSLTYIVGTLVYVLRGGTHGFERTAEQRLHDALLSTSIGTVILPMALAAFVGASLFEMLRTTFAPTLPGLRRRLFRSLVVVALAAAVLSAIWCLAQDASPWPASALGFLAFAFGLFWSDSIWQAHGAWRYPLQVFVLLPIFFAPELAAAFEDLPLVLGPAGLLSGLGLLAWPLGRGPVVRRVLDPKCAERLLVDGERQRARWRASRTLAGPADWTRATLHEAFGHAAGGWMGAALAHAFFFTLALVGLALVPAYARTQDLEQALAHLHAALAVRPTGLEGKIAPVAFALPTFASFFFFHRLTPGAAGVCPLGRRQRAEVVFRSTLKATLAVTGALALLLFGVTEAVFRLGGLAQRSSEIPAFLNALGAVIVTAPIVHAVRERWLERRAAELTVFESGLLGLVAFLVALPGTLLMLVWNEGIGRFSPAAWLLVVLLHVVGSQALWYSYLQRSYASRDLAC